MRASNPQRFNSPVVRIHLPRGFFVAAAALPSEGLVFFLNYLLRFLFVSHSLFMSTLMSFGKGNLLQKKLSLIDQTGQLLLIICQMYHFQYNSLEACLRAATQIS